MNDSDSEHHESGARQEATAARAARAKKRAKKRRKKTVVQRKAMKQKCISCKRLYTEEGFTRCRDSRETEEKQAVEMAHSNSDESVAVQQRQNDEGGNAELDNSDRITEPQHRYNLRPRDDSGNATNTDDQQQQGQGNGDEEEDEINIDSDRDSHNDGMQQQQQQQQHNNLPQQRERNLDDDIREQHGNCARQEGEEEDDDIDVDIDIDFDRQCRNCHRCLHAMDEQETPLDDREHYYYLTLETFAPDAIHFRY